MIASGQEALDLLRKLLLEHLPVCVFFVSADGVATSKLSGYVNAVSQEGGVVFSDGSLVGELRANFLRIDSSSADSFWYGGSGEIPGISQEAREQLDALGSSLLMIRFESGSLLSVLERAESIVN